LHQLYFPPRISDLQAKDPSMNNITFYIKSIPAIPSVLPILKKAPHAVVVTHKAAIYKALKALKLENKIIRYYSNLGRFLPRSKYLRNADVIVSEVRLEDLPKELRRYKAKLINIFHGTFRDIGEVKVRQFSTYDVLLTNGPRQSAMIKRYHDRYPIETHEIGYLPFDNFIQKTPERVAAIKKSLGLSVDKPTIIFLPARRRISSLVPHAQAIQAHISDDYNFIIRPHPNQLDNTKRAEKNVVADLEQKMKNNSQQIFDKGQLNYQELLCICDLLISDATSPTEESLYYDTPQLFTETYDRNDWRKEFEEHDMHEEDIKNLLSMFDLGISYKTSTSKNWAECIEQASATKDDYHQTRQTYYNYAFGEVKGDAAQRAVDVLERL
jgi:CDP-glycerol glycerophosphotransferase (TagB/SpsB family)